MSKVLFTRFLSALVLVCVALSFGLFFPLSALAEDGVSKAQRKYERAAELEEAGKHKKFRKAYRSASKAEYKEQKKLDRATKLREEGKTDTKEYNKLVRSLIDLGNEMAQMYLEEFFVEDVEEVEVVAPPKEYVTTDGWDAAQLGDKYALYLLGEAYLEGLGVEKNRGIAHALFLHAKQRGNGQAINVLVTLEDELTTKDVAKSEVVYADWDIIIKKNIIEERALAQSREDQAISN